MYHFVYKTTNLINGKFYIGVHSTLNLADEYLGSGIVLKRAFKKYGKDNFNREILKILPSREAAFSLEKALVQESQVNAKECYNRALGGYGGNLGEVNGMYGKTHSKEARAKIREAATGRVSCRKGKVHTSETKALMGKKAKERLKNPENNGMYGKKHSKESLRKMKDAQKGEKHWAFGKTGEKCHNYGRKHSDEAKAKMSASRKGHCNIAPAPGKSNPRWKGYWITPFGTFETCQQAADKLKKSRKTIREYCNSGKFPEWYISKELNNG